MKIHLVANILVRYLEYAYLCIDSLVKNGLVEPKDIILTIEDKLCYSNIYRKLSKRYAIHTNKIKFAETINNKFTYLDDIFNRFDDESILQLDTDVYITRSIDFLNLVKRSDDGSDLLICWENNNGNIMMERRNKFWLHPFKYTDTIQSRNRLNEYFKIITGGSLDGYIKWLETSDWVYGGMFIVNRKLTKKRTWSIIKAFSLLTACDETTIQVARYANGVINDNFSSKELVIPTVACPICPPILRFDDPRGMVHYAGDWYRIYNEENREKIESMIDSLLSRNQ